MSWDDADGGDAANRFEISQRLSIPMQELLLTTANNPYRLEAFRRAMGIPDDRAPDFLRLWQRVRQAMIDRDDIRSGSYTRNNVYLDFLTRPGTPVQDCILDYGKPFVRELKQIVDFRYALNLPAALQIHPMSSYENKLWDYEMMERRGYQAMRTISAEELYCAVAMFWPAFLKNLHICGGADVTLSTAARIRRLPEWTAYLEALDAARKRANLNEIDFHDVEVIFKRFRTMLAVCARKIPDLFMEEVPGCLSVIYRFGGSCLIAVYRQGEDEVCILTDGRNTLSDRFRENVSIDFYFGDWRQRAGSSNCLLERLRLFEGILQESPRAAYEKVLAALKKHPHTVEENGENANL